MIARILIGWAIGSVPVALVWGRLCRERTAVSGLRRRQLEQLVDRDEVRP